MNSSFGNITTIDDDAPSKAITLAFGIYYAIVFCFGFAGNILIMTAVFKFKTMKTVVNGFLANLALADILFILLSLFDALNFFLGEWVFGDVACRMQSMLIEVSYTISVMTLAVVALERYVSICYPYRKKRTFKQSLYISAVLWLIAVVFCSSLLHGYATRIDDNDNSVKYTCANDNWSKESRLAFYLVHTVLIYLLPLTVMCISHYKISKVLIRQKRMRTFTVGSGNKQEFLSTSVGNISDSSTASINRPDNNNSLSSLAKKRQQTVHRRVNIIRLLVFVTASFFVLWTPFIFVRLLLYIGVDVHKMIWRGCQLLIFANTAVNCVIYAAISPAFKKAFKALFACGTGQASSMNHSISRSFDYSQSTKKHSVINHPIVA